MGKLASALLGLAAGYAAGAALGWLLVTAASGNTHDKSVEAVMTAFFAAGPLGAIIGAVAGFAMARRKRG